MLPPDVRSEPARRPQARCAHRRSRRSSATARRSARSASAHFHSYIPSANPKAAWPAASFGSSATARSPRCAREAMPGWPDATGSTPGAHNSRPAARAPRRIPGRLQWPARSCRRLVPIRPRHRDSGGPCPSDRVRRPATLAVGGGTGPEKPTRSSMRRAPAIERAMSS